VAAAGIEIDEHLALFERGEEGAEGAGSDIGLRGRRSARESFRRSDFSTRRTTRAGAPRDADVLMRMTDPLNGRFGRDTVTYRRRRPTAPVEAAPRVSLGF
jgi:hypothetical protein